MRKQAIWLSTLLLIPVIGFAQTGEELAALCSGCHGKNGISINDETPNLAAQKRAYIVKAVKDYRSGRRSNPMMSAMAANLKDEEIELLATYFSELKHP